MKRLVLLAIVVASSAMLVAGGARAQVSSTSGSSSSSGAVAVANGGGLNFAPSSTVTYPRQPPAQALGSFGQGANPCAEGGGFNLGTGYFGFGFNQATSGKQCEDRLTASALLEAGKQFGDERAAIAGLLTLCGSDPSVLQKCEWAGLWTRPAAMPAPPPSLYAGYYDVPQAPVRPVATMPVVPVEPYVPYRRGVHRRPPWCDELSPGEMPRFARDCDP